jgi:hypothetical protein
MVDKKNPNYIRRQRAIARRKRQIRIRVATVTGIFVLFAIIIFATKYKGDFKRIFGGESADKTTEAVDNKKGDTTSEAATGSEDTTGEAVTDGSDASTEEQTAGVDVAEAARADSINVTNPDLSSKGSDWYDDTIFEPGNVTDDAYFDKVALIGDSRTEGLAFYCDVNNWAIMADKGLTASKALENDIVKLANGTTVTPIEALGYKEYKYIYIGFGMNELGWLYPEVFIDDYKTFIQEVKKVQPNAVIMVESILPVSASKSASDENINNSKITTYNGMLLDMCKEFGDVIYLDTASAVTVDGALPEEASTDGVHCDKNYNEKILEYIRKNTYVRKTAQ